MRLHSVRSSLRDNEQPNVVGDNCFFVSDIRERDVKQFDKTNTELYCETDIK